MKELIAEATQHHPGMDHDSVVNTVRSTLEDTNHSVTDSHNELMGDKTSFLLAKHPVFGELMYTIHTPKDGETSSSRVCCGGQVKSVTEEVQPISESWEDFARRKAVAMLG